MTSDPAVEIESSPGRMEGLKLCLELFFDRHFASDFCSFDHRADFEEKCANDPLLYYAIIALCGRYLSDQDAHGLYGFPSGAEVSLHYLHKVRPVAKASVDEPSSELLPDYSFRFGVEQLTHLVHSIQHTRYPDTRACRAAIQLGMPPLAICRRSYPHS